MLRFVLLSHRERKYQIISKCVKCLGQAFLICLVYKINTVIVMKISYLIGWLFVCFTLLRQLMRLQSSPIPSVALRD
jgi:hypothetical protein